MYVGTRENIPDNPQEFSKILEDYQEFLIGRVVGLK